ncbi:MAG: OB-fold nucleic acid binding domain-containing protein, partial [Candidatus Saccharimonadales bacterium]
YLKAHYPDAFMAALMTSDQDDIDRLAIEITECKHMGIEVLAPDVNESFVEFAVVPDKKQIRFGMAAIKGVGTAAVKEILRTRDTDGKFVTIEDFARRVSTSKFNKKAWESLIKSGGFDGFGDRSDLLFNLETIQNFGSKTQKEALSGQTDLFGILGADNNIMQPSLNLQQAPVKHTQKERLTWERELLGLYISAHPLDNYDTYFEEQTVPLSSIKPDVDGKKATIGGIITTVRSIVTKTGSKMAFVGIEDKTGEGELIVFPNLYADVGAKLAQDVVLRATGKVNARDRDGNLQSDAKLIADEIVIVSEKDLNDYEPTGHKMTVPKSRSPTPGGVTISRAVMAKSEPRPVVVAEEPNLKKLFVHVRNPDNHEVLRELREISSGHPGLSDIVLVLGEDKKSAIKLPFRVEHSDTLVSKFVKLLGEDAVTLK